MMADYIQRPALLEQLIRQKDKEIIKVVTGARRTGKSFLLFQIFYQYLIQSGVPKERIIRIDLETYKNKPYRNPDSLYQYVTSQIINSELRTYVMIDEIQFVESFEDVVMGLMLDENCDVYVTGSNAKLLSKDIHTRFRGRSTEIRVYPLNFQEYAEYRQCSGRISEQQLLNDYLLDGGMPYAVMLEHKDDRYKYLSDICELVVFRDIIERYEIRNENLLKAVFDVLCSSIGCYVSANSIANTLKSNGYPKVTPDTVGNYLEYFCDAFLFYKVHRFDIKGKAYLKTQNKYYVTDLGIRNSHLNFRQLEITHSIENLVYLELLRRGYIVDIGKNSDKEIDFVVNSNAECYYIQVSYSIADPCTRERELSAFSHIRDNYKKIIITMDNDPYCTIENGYKKVNLIDFLTHSNCLEAI